MAYRHIPSRQLRMNDAQQNGTGIVGTVQVSADGEAGFVLRWTVDGFLNHMKQDYFLRSPEFSFRSGNFFLLIPDSFGSETYKPEVHMKWPYDADPRIPFSWKLSAESVDGTLCQCAEGVEEEMDYTMFELGSLRDIERLLHPDDSLVLIFELRRIQEETAAKNLSASSLQHPGMDVLVRDLERLLSSGDASDATVRVKGQKDFRVHRNILGARTPVFSSMFKHQMSEKASGVVNIEDCEPETFGQFLHYVYTGRVKDLRPESAIPLYQVADKYQVEELKLECLENIKGALSVKSFCPILTLALTYSEKELTRLATDFFVGQAKEITSTVEWQKFLCENPIQANELIVKMFRNTQENTTSSKNLSM